MTRARPVGAVERAKTKTEDRPHFNEHGDAPVDLCSPIPIRSLNCEGLAVSTRVRRQTRPCGSAGALDLANSVSLWGGACSWSWWCLPVSVTWHPSLFLTLHSLRCVCFFCLQTRTQSYHGVLVGSCTFCFCLSWDMGGCSWLFILTVPFPLPCLCLCTLTTVYVFAAN